jgi:hypothetical protein
MLTALIAVGGMLAATLGYSIWSRIRIGKLHSKIGKLNDAANGLEAELVAAQIQIESLKGFSTLWRDQLDAEKRVTKTLRNKVNEILKLVSQGKLSHADAIRDHLAGLL